MGKTRNQSEPGQNEPGSAALNFIIKEELYMDLELCVQHVGSKNHFIINLCPHWIEGNTYQFLNVYAKIILSFK